VFLFEEGGVLMEFSNLVVFELVRCGEFGELLVEEGGIGLVFAVHSLLLAGQLRQRGLHRVQLRAAAG
jgi:hypothetical protein